MGLQGLSFGRGSESCSINSLLFDIDAYSDINGGHSIVKILCNDCNFDEENVHHLIHSISFVLVGVKCLCKCRMTLLLMKYFSI